eukprot:jgi/Chrzof1/11844/Cz06g12040.t1
MLMVNPACLSTRLPSTGRSNHRIGVLSELLAQRSSVNIGCASSTCLAANLASGRRRLQTSRALHGAAEDVTSALQQLLTDQLDMQEECFGTIIRDPTVSQSLAGGPILHEIGAGLDSLLHIFSKQEVASLIKKQPALLAAPIKSWMDFFDEYGFSKSQVKNLIGQSPQVLADGSLVTAGNAIILLKALGFDNDEVRHRVVAYCPQVLMMQPEQIKTLIRLWAKFRVGVDERSTDW